MIPSLNRALTAATHQVIGSGGHATCFRVDWAAGSRVQQRMRLYCWTNAGEAGEMIQQVPSTQRALALIALWSVQRIPQRTGQQA